MSRDVALAVAYEDVLWRGSPEGEAAMSRREKLASRGGYRAAVPPCVTGHRFVFDAQVSAAAEDALVEIARFDSELPVAASGAGAEFAPLAAVLLRTESASSSRIENVTAGAKALAMAAIDAKAGPNARLVAANVEAMQRAIDMADDLGIDSLLAAHAALMHSQPEALPGRFRESQVWIGSHAPTPHTASFVPPQHPRVEPLMDDLLSFCERTDLPVLAHVALAHAQFETIHPFADGNGRTGRVLVHVLLRRAGTTRHVTVPVSAGLLTDTHGYFDALTAYREGWADPIVECFTAASFAAIDNARVLNGALADALARWEHDLGARRDSAAWRLLPHLLQQPAVTIALVQQLTGVSNPAATRAVERLVAAHVLRPAGSARRNRVWLAPDVIDALDAFAARTGRRG